MTKRKVNFNVPDVEPQNKTSRFKEDHSLDSDEDEELEQKITSRVNDEVDVLDEEDIEGQEEDTIREDDGISVTPFNLREELEEGHFDRQGNYIPNEVDDVTDGWLESVDWSKVKDSVDKVEDTSMTEQAPVDLKELKVQMIKLMKPGESVLKSIRRLGGNKKPVSSADRWKKKKQNVELSETQKVNSENMLKLTGLADVTLQNGDFQIYEKTFEQLSFEVNEKSQRAATSSQFQDADDEDDEDEQLESAFKQHTADENMKNNDESISKPCSVQDDADAVFWNYKLENTDTSEIVGTFSSAKMLQLQENGTFGEGVYCRRVGTDGSFYNSNRIDFDLYT